MEITNNSMELFNTLNEVLKSMAIAQTVRLDVIDHPTVRSFLITLSKGPQSAILVNAKVISKLVEKIEQVVSVIIVIGAFSSNIPNSHTISANLILSLVTLRIKSYNYLLE